MIHIVKSIAHLRHISAFDNYFLQAQRVRQLVRNDFDRIFSLPNFYFTDPSIPLAQEGPSKNADQVDVLVHPSAIRTALPIVEEKDESASDLDSYVQDVLTVPASLAGLPALSVPVPEKFLDPEGDGWPIGVSVVGQWGSDELVMRVGEVVEQLG
jgi:aspartyl-tRNA(Asn)/glutamyl-tRNA(Gln) amidotransferase subunit A